MEAQEAEQRKKDAKWVADAIAHIDLDEMRRLFLDEDLELDAAPRRDTRQTQAEKKKKKS